MVTYVFLLNGALFTVVSVGNTWASANNTSALVGSVVALVADSHQSARPHVRITNDALSVTFFT